MKKKIEKWNDKASEPKSQSFIFHMYIYIYIYIFEDCSLQVPEKNITQIYPEKTEKRTNKGKNKSNKPSFQSHDTTMHCSSLNSSLKKL